MDWAELIDVFSYTALLGVTAVTALWLLSIVLRDISSIDMAFPGLSLAILACTNGRRRAWHFTGPGGAPNLIPMASAGRPFLDGERPWAR